MRAVDSGLNGWRRNKNCREETALPVWTWTRALSNTHAQSMCLSECERRIFKRLHSAKSTGGSIRNIWVWGGQGGFCLQAVHWPDTSPRFSLAFYTGGGKERGREIREEELLGVRLGRERCLLYCTEICQLPGEGFITKSTHCICERNRLYF